MHPNMFSFSFLVTHSRRERVVMTACALKNGNIYLAAYLNFNFFNFSYHIHNGYIFSESFYLISASTNKAMLKPNVISLSYAPCAFRSLLLSQSKTLPVRPTPTLFFPSRHNNLGGGSQAQLDRNLPRSPDFVHEGRGVHRRARGTSLVVRSLPIAAKGRRNEHNRKRCGIIGMSTRCTRRAL
jgi:hypothetical protein